MLNRNLFNLFENSFYRDVQQRCIPTEKSGQFYNAVKKQKPKFFQMSFSRIMSKQTDVQTEPNKSILSARGFTNTNGEPNTTQYVHQAQTSI
jgi:hypothetical protein